MSFDATGNLWIGDVGQSTYEEVNFIPGGSTAARISAGMNVKAQSLMRADHWGRCARQSAIPVFPRGRTIDHRRASSMTKTCPGSAGQVHIWRLHDRKDLCAGEVGLYGHGDRNHLAAFGPIGAYELASFGLDTQHNLYAIKIDGVAVKP